VRILAELGSVVGQGWYYARPMDAGQLVDWLRDWGITPCTGANPATGDRNRRHRADPWTAPRVAWSTS
jgi:hypothetical protein